MKKSVKIGEVAADTLRGELANIETTISKGAIVWRNSKGESRNVPWSRVNRLGAFVGDKETEADAFEAFLAMTFKLQSEQKAGAKAENGTVAVRAGHSVKMGTASCAVRVARMDESKAKVSCQLAAAQKMHKRADDIRTELARREAAEKAAAEAAAKLGTEAEILESLMGKQAAPVAAPAPLAKAA